MRRSSTIAFFTASSLFLATLAFGQGTYKVAQAGPPGAEVPAPIQALLPKQGVRFENAQGTVVCDIWWRKDIPTTKSSSLPDVLYSGLSVGEFVGVLHFPSASTDYRGQSIKPGFYTLRYALIPQDGNHMGVSTYRDFLLLIPIADDPHPSQTMTFDQVVKASRLAAGTGHPAVMMLDPVSQNATRFPSAFKDDQGNWALDVKLDVTQGGAAQQLPFAMILVGQYQG